MSFSEEYSIDVSGIFHGVSSSIKHYILVYEIKQRKFLVFLIIIESNFWYEIHAIDLSFVYLMADISVKSIYLCLLELENQAMETNFPQTFFKTRP